ncbi:hypothetical protein QC760_001431 [Botrytis cinerea]
MGLSRMISWIAQKQKQYRGKGEEECRKEDSGVDGDNAFEDVAKDEPEKEAQESHGKSNGEERAGSKEEGDMEGSGA